MFLDKYVLFILLLLVASFLQIIMNSSFILGVSHTRMINTAYINERGCFSMKVFILGYEQQPDGRVQFTPKLGTRDVVINLPTDTDTIIIAKDRNVQHTKITIYATDERKD